MNREEKNRVEKHSIIAHYDDQGVMSRSTEYCGNIFLRYMNQKGSVLELGPAEGIMTDLLAPCFGDYTVVDGAGFFVEAIKERHPDIQGYGCLFEEFKPTRKWNNIVLGHVLEHVENPVEILKSCATWLAGEGVLVAAVPNSHSLHRQAAVYMGMLESEKQLNETDLKNGHRRVYDVETLKADFLSAGFSIKKTGGYWLKPESNGQINKNWDNRMIDAFMHLGEQYPDIAGEIYIIAQRG